MTEISGTHNSRLSLLKQEIGDRPVLIWGARALGCGICKVAERMKLNVTGFIDSDPCFRGKKITGYEVFAPDRVAGLEPMPYVITASSLSEEVLARKCMDMGMKPETDFCSAKEVCDSEYIIDVVGMCNLRCPSCPRGNYASQPDSGLMSVELFEKCIKKILAETPDVNIINLFNWGEPFLHPQLPKLIGILRKHNIYCSLSTNLNVAKDIAPIIKAKPDMIKVSLSGYFQQTYGFFHKNGDINLVKSNLYRLRYLSDKYCPDLVIEVIYHRYRNNLGEDYANMERLCRELGFLFSSCVAYMSPVEKLIDCVEGRLSDRDRKLTDQLLVRIEHALEKTMGRQRGICPLLEKQIVINWDGSISLCCASFDPASTRVHEDFLRVSNEEIKKAKVRHPLCAVCRRYGIDQYYCLTSQEEG